MKAFKTFFGLFILPVMLAKSQPYVSQAEFVSNESGYLQTLLDKNLLFDTLAPPTTRNQILITDEAEAWKQWRVVGNFAFEKDRGSLPMIADLQSLHPYFRDKIIQLINICKKKGIELAVVESFRTRAKQSEYYSMGKKYTRTTEGKSKHQYGLAVDLVPIINGQPEWDNKALWRRIGLIGESLGLRWGGRWRSIYDPAHFEWTGGISISHLTKGIDPPIPNPAQYPCIHEDIDHLKKHWEAWETEQSSLARQEDSQDAY